MAIIVKMAPLIHPMVPTPMPSCLAPPVARTSAGATPSPADTMVEIPTPTVTMATRSAANRNTNDRRVVGVSTVEDTRSHYVLPHRDVRSVAPQSATLRTVTSRVTELSMAGLDGTPAAPTPSSGAEEQTDWCDGCTPRTPHGASSATVRATSLHSHASTERSSRRHRSRPMRPYLFPQQ